MAKRQLRTETLAAIGVALTSTGDQQSRKGLEASWKIHQREVVGALQLNGYTKQEAEDAFLKITAVVYFELGRFKLKKSKFINFKELVADILTRVPGVVPK